MSTLVEMRLKIRRLTGRPSPQQITDAQINEYINTFYLYDLPETLRLVTQSTTFKLMTEANVDTYDMNTELVTVGGTTEPAVDTYITLNPPAYVSGQQAFWGQSREQFFLAYPPLSQVIRTVLGDGTAGPYSVTFPNTPILQNCVTVGAVNINSQVENFLDVPTNRNTGQFREINTDSALTGSVNYLAGTASITFSANIVSGENITFSAVPYVAGRPQSILFYDNTLTFRPVPDASYKVEINAYRRPTSLLADGDFPQLKQWWQYLAYGATKKIFEDSDDREGVASIMQALKEQERLVLRRTIIQRTNQRTSTIYTETGLNGYGYGNYFNNG